MNGVTLLREIHQQAGESVLMMLTAHTDVTVAVTALHEGHISRFLRKPWDPNLLVRFVDDGVRQYRLLVSEKQMSRAIERLNRRLKRKLGELEDANDLLRQWVEFSPAVIYLSELPQADHVVTYASSNVDQLAGITSEELQATPGLWMAQVEPDDRTRLQAELAGAAELPGKTFCIEYRIRHRNATEHWIQDKFRAQPAKLTGRVEFVGAWLDISESKARERQAFALDDTIPHDQVH